MWVIMQESLRLRMCERIQESLREDDHQVGAVNLVKNAVWRVNHNGAVYVDRATALVLLQWVPQEDNTQETDLLGHLVRDENERENEQDLRVVLHAIAGMQLCRYAQFIDSK
jgi:hypothetical protein